MWPASNVGGVPGPAKPRASRGAPTNVGDVTGPSKPSACRAPRTTVLLPAPSSPETRTTSPGCRRAASSAPARSGSPGAAVSSVRLTEAQPQRQAGAEQERAPEARQPGVGARVGKRGRRRAGGRLRARGRGGRGGGRLRGGGRRGGRRLRGGGRRGGRRRRARARGGRGRRLVGAERLRVLVAAGALGVRCRGRGEREDDGGRGGSVPETHRRASVEIVPIG